MELKSYIAKTDQGPFLNLNEDDVIVDMSCKLFVVMDGYGGTGIGDKCVKKIGDDIKRFYTQFSGDQDSTLPFYFSHKYLIEGNGLLNAIRLAHTEVLNDNSSRPMNERAGASVLCAALSDNILEIISSGNIIAYLSRRGSLSRVVIPHNHETLGGDQYERHFLTAPTSGIGLFEDVHTTTAEIKLVAGDHILLMTDGIYSRLTDEEIKYVVNRTDIDHFQRADELMKMANHRGNCDNQSIILLEF